MEHIRLQTHCHHSPNTYLRWSREARQVNDTSQTTFGHIEWYDAMRWKEV